MSGFERAGCHAHHLQRFMFRASDFTKDRTRATSCSRSIVFESIFNHAHSLTDLSATRSKLCLLIPTTYLPFPIFLTSCRVSHQKSPSIHAWRSKQKVATPGSTTSDPGQQYGLAPDKCHAGSAVETPRFNKSSSHSRQPDHRLPRIFRRN